MLYIGYLQIVVGKIKVMQTYYGTTHHLCRRTVPKFTINKVYKTVAIEAKCLN